MLGVFGKTVKESKTWKATLVLCALTRSSFKASQTECLSQIPASHACATLNSEICLRNSENSEVYARSHAKSELEVTLRKS